MTPENLRLPEPAKSLMRAAGALLDETLTPIVAPGKRWRLGGGTLLAARWGHRRSTDIDIFLPEDSGIAALDPRSDPGFAQRMQALGATRVEAQGQSLKFAFPAGRIEITQLDQKPSIAPARAMVDGREMAVYGNATILTGKLFGRGRRLPVRDVFDIAVGWEEDPDALRTAVNYLDESLRSEILHSLRMEADTYVEEAKSEVIDPAPKWSQLVEGAPAAAVEAMERAS